MPKSLGMTPHWNYNLTIYYLCELGFLQAGVLPSVMHHSFYKKTGFIFQELKKCCIVVGIVLLEIQTAKTPCSITGRMLAPTPPKKNSKKVIFSSLLQILLQSIWKYTYGIYNANYVVVIFFIENTSMGAFLLGFFLVPLLYGHLVLKFQVFDHRPQKIICTFFLTSDDS